MDRTDASARPRKPTWAGVHVRMGDRQASRGRPPIRVYPTEDAHDGDRPCSDYATGKMRGAAGPRLGDVADPGGAAPAGVEHRQPRAPRARAGRASRLTHATDSKRTTARLLQGATGVRFSAKGSSRKAGCPLGSSAVLGERAAEGDADAQKAFTAQPLASRIRPMLRWLSFRYAMIIEGPRDGQEERHHPDWHPHAEPEEGGEDAREEGRDTTHGHAEGRDRADVDLRPGRWHRLVRRLPT